MNKSVSFPLAKLLNKKGYDEPCPDLYYEPERCKKPTIAEVVMWFYEKHGIWIISRKALGINKWFYTIYKNDDAINSEYIFNSPTEAYEAAIEYVLTKII